MSDVEIEDRAYWRAYWQGYLKGPVVPGKHYHAYRWVGESWKLDTIKTQAERNPGSQEWATSDLPPESVRHYLLKPRLLTATFETASDAADWIRAQWDEKTPSETEKNPDSHREYAEVCLSHGQPDVFSWRIPEMNSRTKVHLTVIPCPYHWPDDPGPMPCPQPPA